MIPLDGLEASLSTDRFGTYLTAVNGNRAEAVGLYTWNMAVSAVFYGPLQAFEVALRGAMSRELAGVYGQTWHARAKAGMT